MTDDRAWLGSAAILARLAAGEVVLLATDTVPGLHARVDRPAALAALRALKERAADKPLLVLAASVDQAFGLVATVPPAVSAYLETCWPGPFTCVLPAAAGLPAAVIAEAGTVALRVPGWPALRELLAASGPLASSSANLAGRPAATGLEQAARDFPGLPVWSPAPLQAAGSASALLDLTGPSPRLLRAGPLAAPPWPPPPASG